MSTFTTLRRAWTRAPFPIQIIAAAMVALLLGPGCTSIPQRQFQNYRDAFSQVRAQSETVLADHLAARQEKTNRLRAATLASSGAGSSLSETLGIQPISSRATEVRDTADIETRLRAWEVLAAYNEALAAVASGASASETGEAVNGFLDALKKFPVAEVAEFAGEAIPYAGVVTPLVEMVQKEVEARRFKNAVLRAEPRIQEFTGLLSKDAALFHRYRVALYNESFPERQNSINQLVDQFRELTITNGWSSARTAKVINGLIREVNGFQSIGGMFTFKALPEASTNGPAATDQGPRIAQLTVIAKAVADEATAARQIVSELRAYDELMKHYAAEIEAWRASVAELARAAAHSSNQLPNMEQLKQVVAAARLAEKVYAQSK